MTKIRIIFFMLISFTACSKESNSTLIKNKVIFLINSHSEISKENKVKLIAQSALETGHFKHIKYKNNVFNIKRVEHHKYGYANFKTLKECIDKRVSLFVSKNHKFTKDYAINPNYNKLLNKVFNYVKRKYNLTALTLKDNEQKCPHNKIFQTNFIIIPYRYRFT